MRTCPVRWRFLTLWPPKCFVQLISNSTEQDAKDRMESRTATSRFGVNPQEGKTGLCTHEGEAPKCSVNEGTRDPDADGCGYADGNHG